MIVKVPELSIFFPFWNEEKNVQKVVFDAIPIADKIAKKWEIIMVNDGSSDKTALICGALAKKDDRLKLISHHPNRGYGAALKEGLVNAKYDLVVFTDGDGQFDFSEVTKFIEKIDGCDMVIGYRKKRKDNFVRHVLMMMLRTWDFVFFRFYFKDIDYGFKLFKKEALNKIMPLRSEGAMITTEILAKAKMKKILIKEVEVNHYPRKFGNQSGANLPVIIRAVLESFMLWLDIKNGRI